MDENSIKITYCLNPYVFWFTYKKDVLKNRRSLAELQEVIDKYIVSIGNKYADGYVPKLNEDVLVLYTKHSNKWIRAIVDDIKDETNNVRSFILWSIDHGFPLKTQSKWIRPGTQKLSDIKLNNIHLGGIMNVVPPTQVPLKGSRILRETSAWSTEAVKKFTRAISLTKEFTFKSNFSMENVDYRTQHNFGNLTLIISDSDSDSNASTKMDAVSFLKGCSQIVTSSVFLAALQISLQLNYCRYESILDEITYNQNANEIVLLKESPQKCKSSSVKSQEKSQEKPQENPQEKSQEKPQVKSPAKSQMKSQVTSMIKSQVIAQENSPMKPLVKSQIKSIKDIDIAEAGPSMLISKKNVKHHTTQIHETGNDVIDLTNDDDVEENQPIDQQISNVEDTVDDLIHKFRKVKVNTNTQYQRELKVESIKSRTKLHRILVHGKQYSTPIEYVNQAFFTEEIHTEMASLRFQQVYRIQSYAWPHLMRGNSLFLINQARSGKTLAYIPAVLSLLTDSYIDNVEKGVGPIIIIICPSSVEVENTTRLCQRLLRNYKDGTVNIVQAYGSQFMQKYMIHLLNGCEILVCTAPCLQRLLNVDEMKLFNRKRIKYFIIENIDSCTRFMKDIKAAFKSLYTFDTCRLIITSRVWIREIKDFFKIVLNPLLIIGAYIEAAVYAKSKMKLQFHDKCTKLQTVSAYLSTINFRDEITMIIAKTNDETKQIAEYLNLVSIFNLLCNNETDRNSIANIQHNSDLYENNKFVIICSDETLIELNIRNVQHIIHYSLPLTWSQFSYRFSVCLDYYPDFLLELKDKPKPPATSLIILDECNNDQLPRLVEFLQSHGANQINESIFALTKRIQINNEENQITSQRLICGNILQLGECNNKSSCSYRHVLTKHDAPTVDMPKSGWIKCQILNVNSPTHYSVRLLEHKRDNKKWKQLLKSNEYLTFSIRFESFYSNPDRHCIHFPVELHDLCVVFEDGKYQRCKIINIKKKYLRPEIFDEIISLRLIDVGGIIERKSSDLLFLTDEFYSFPAQAIDLRLTGIVPHDFEAEFDSYSIKTVKKWLETYLKENVYVRAQIELTLRDTIFITSLQLIERLTDIKSEIILFSIERALLERKICIADNTPYNTLKTLAGESDILTKDDNVNENSSIEDNEKVANIGDTNPNMNKKKSYRNYELECDSNAVDKWESFELNTFENIVISTFINPFYVYVQKYSSQEKLIELTKEIDLYVKEYQTGNLKKDIQYEISMTCLVKLDNIYYRAKIFDYYCDDSNGIKCTVFLCDIGEQTTVNVSEILNIPKFLIDFLPFQAILCKMIGILPKHSDHIWTATVCDKIYDDILEPCMYLCIKNIVDTSDITDENILKFYSYESILINCVLHDENDAEGATAADENININKLLILKNLARSDPDTNQYLNIDLSNITNNNNNDFDNNNDDDDDYIGNVENWDNEEKHPDFMLKKENIVQSAPPPNIFIDTDDLDFQFTEDEFYNMINGTPLLRDHKIIKNKKETATITEIVEKKLENLPTAKKVTEQSVAVPKIKITENGVDKKANKSTDKQSRMPGLNYITKVPEVVWQQSESIITVKIHAADVIKYFIEITSNRLHVTYLLNNLPYSVLLNLFGCVNVKYCSHNQRGLYINVILLKKLPGYFWPRITAESDKHRWLKYNYNHLNVDSKNLFNFDDTNDKFNNYNYNIDDSEEESDHDLGQVTNDYEDLADLMVDDFTRK